MIWTLVTQHEMGHIFGAGDNYYAPGYGGCAGTTYLNGYLGIANSNCEKDNPSADTDVLMNNNNPNRMHWTGQYQVGWRDTDDDHLADEVDTQPVFIINGIGAGSTINGVIYDQPFDSNTYSPDVTLNTIVSARYRVDSGSWQTLSAKDGAFNSDREEVTLNPGSLVGTDHTITVEATNSRGNTSTTTQAVTPAVNDLLVNATPMTAGSTYLQTVSVASITPEEPLNVCNSADTGSVWYKFTAPSTGVYKVSALGSSYSPDLSILRQVSSTTRTPVVCGVTDVNYSYDDDFGKVAFNATGGYTYLIEVSDAAGGGNLSLRIDKETCPAGYLCGAAVGGDGSILRYADMEIYDAGGNYYQGYGYGDLAGFVTGYLYGSGSGNYMVGTYGNWEDGVGNMILNQSVHIPGYYAPSAVGLPKTSISLRNISGNPVAIDTAVIVRTGNRDMGGFFYGDGSLNPFELYAPAGSYNLAGTNREAKLEVYQPGVNIVSASDPGTVTLDASILPQDTFTFNLDGLSNLTVWIYTPEYYGAYMQLTGSGAVTFAAPADTRIPTIDSEILKTDASDLYWHYRMLIDENTSIQGGHDHAYQVGGTLAVNPYAAGAPLRRDEGYGELKPGITDAHGNVLTNLYYEGYDTGGAKQTSLQERQEFIHNLEYLQE